MNRYEYLKNELDHAELKAKTLPSILDRSIFAVHADNLRERLGRMTPAEGAVVMFDDEDVTG